MKRLCRRDPWARKSDVESVRTDVLGNVDRLRVELAATGVPPSVAAARRRRLAWLVATLALATGLASWLVLASAISASPTSIDPGRIGVAVVDQDAEQPVQVSATFGVAAESSTRFQIVVSDFSGGTGEVALFFCGPIRDGLSLEEMNQGPMVLSPAPNSPAVYDSILGNRGDCSYTTSRLEPGHQTIVVGQSRYSFLTRTGANVLYTVPGVRTILTRERLGGETLAPLDHASTVRVTMDGLPNDLQIAAAVPQLPDSGQPSWSYEIGQYEAPGEYRVMGHLVTTENRAQTSIFFAGALAGIAGGAVLWFFEIFVTRAPSRSMLPAAATRRNGRAQPS